MSDKSLTTAEIDSFRAYAKRNTTDLDGNPSQWADYTLRLIVEVERLRERDERLVAMLPLFEEARLRGLDLTLADRMDDVGIPDRWKARQAALKGDE